MATMNGVFPLPLSAREISDWLESHPSALPREEIDDVVFALDQVCLAQDEV